MGGRPCDTSRGLGYQGGGRGQSGEATAVGKLALDVLSPYIAAALVYLVLVQLLDFATRLFNRWLSSVSKPVNRRIAHKTR